MQLLRTKRLSLVLLQLLARSQECFALLLARIRGPESRSKFSIVIKRWLAQILALQLLVLISSRLAIWITAAAVPVVVGFHQVSHSLDSLRPQGNMELQTASSEITTWSQLHESLFFPNHFKLIVVDDSRSTSSKLLWSELLWISWDSCSCLG